MHNPMVKDTKPHTIYIVEDEADILDLLQITLRGAGFATRGFLSAAPMLDALREKAPDLLLLDLMLPDMDGMEVCRLLRGEETTRRLPVVMLTARGDLSDRVRGLEYGADDYITKPYESAELIARVKAVLRRAAWEDKPDVLQITPEFVLDFNSFEARVRGRRLDLTLTELKILQLLTRRPEWVYSRSRILDHLWGTDKIVIERSVDVHIRNLREKLGEFAWMVRNVRGAGYKFSTSTDTTGEQDGSPQP